MRTPKHGIIVRSVMLTGLVMGSAGCATMNPSQPQWEGKPRVSEGDIAVVVENLIWNDVVIYSQSAGSRVRLGTVTTGRRSQFKIPYHQRFASDLELVADPIGSRYPIMSGPVVATLGQEVRWTIHRNAAIRAITVW